MKRIFCLLIAFIFVFLFLILNSCVYEGEISMEDFEKEVVSSKKKIQNIDSSLEIYESTTVFEDGDHRVGYLVSTPSDVSFSIVIDFISPKRSELYIDFLEAADNFDESNINLYAALIAALTNYDVALPEVKEIVGGMEESENYRFDSHRSLSWWNSTLAYREVTKKQ